MSRIRSALAIAFTLGLEVAAFAGVTLPANTPILLTALGDVTSQKSGQGDWFAMQVARDVLVNGQIVIPRGASATGRISYRSGKAGFGKSAVLEFDCVSVEAGGRTVPLSGHYRVAGDDNSGPALSTVVAAGPFAAFVTGHSAVISQTVEWRAYTRAAVTLP